MTEVISNPVTLPKDFRIDPQTNALQLSNGFESTLANIKATVEGAQNLLDMSQVNLSDIDETQLEDTITNLKSAQSLSRYVDEQRKEIRKYFNQRRDQVIVELDRRLNEAHYNQLTEIDAKTKQMKKDLSAYRINQRWEELQSTFTANLANYPLIQQYAPALTSFDTFRLRHPKLVSGGKNAKIGDKQRAAVNNELYSINEILQDMIANRTKLKPAYLNLVLQAFIQNPTKTAYLEALRTAQETQTADEQQALAAQKAQAKAAEIAAQAAKAKAEQDRLAAEQRAALQAGQLAQAQALQKKQDALAQQRSQQAAAAKAAQEKQAALQAARAQQRSKSQKWLSDLVMANRHLYGNLVNDPAQRVKLMYDLMHALDNPESAFSKFVNNSDTMIIDVMRQVATV